MPIEVIQMEILNGWYIRLSSFIRIRISKVWICLLAKQFYRHAAFKCGDGSPVKGPLESAFLSMAMPMGFNTIIGSVKRNILSCRGSSCNAVLKRCAGIRRLWYHYESDELLFLNYFLKRKLIACHSILLHLENPQYHHGNGNSRASCSFLKTSQRFLSSVVNIAVNVYYLLPHLSAANNAQSECVTVHAAEPVKEDRARYIQNENAYGIKSIIAQNYYTASVCCFQ